MGRRKTGRKKSGMKIPDINISNRTLKIIVGVLVLVCLLAGGVYVDTFHGKGLLKEMFSKDTLATPSEAESNATVESMAVDISSKATTAVFGKRAGFIGTEIYGRADFCAVWYYSQKTSCETLRTDSRCSCHNPHSI